MIHKIKVCSQNNDIINKVIAPNINQRMLKAKTRTESYKSKRKSNSIRGVFRLRVSAWLENRTIFLQFTLPGTNSEVKCSS